MTEDNCEPCHNLLNCMVASQSGLVAKCIHARDFKQKYGDKKVCTNCGGHGCRACGSKGYVAVSGVVKQ